MENDQKWLDDWERSPEEWAEAVEAAYAHLCDSGRVPTYIGEQTRRDVSDVLARGLVLDDPRHGEIVLVPLPRRLDWARRTVRPILRIMGYVAIKGRHKIEWLEAAGDDSASLLALTPAR